MQQLSLQWPSQRWRARRATYRPAGEPIVARQYEVALIPDDTTAKRFVVEHHYSGTYPAARVRVGLLRRATLVGVAVFSHPCNERSLAWLPTERLEAVELGRFVLLDEVPANGETWFLARAFEMLRRGGVRSVLSFSDPQPRQTLDGELVLPRHVGTIYQAHNAVYLGRSAARTLRLLPDGRVLGERTLSKIRRRGRGWRYAAAQLEAGGADQLGDDADPGVWLATWLPRVTRPLRHAGNHKYLWALDARLRRHLPPTQPYPKAVDGPLRCATPDR
jgi:hypothetical protein